MKIERRSNCFRSLGDGLAVALVAQALTACGGERGADPKVVAGSHDEGIAHEPCTGEHVESLDTNGDGKPDIQRVIGGGGRELCRSVDLNRDGKPDLYEYFDDSGAVRRREFCYDDTGTVNAIESYEGGRLVQRQYDLGGQHRIDTWDWFDPSAPIDAKTGRPAHPVRRERDTTGDGRVDQWWTWNGDKVTIAADRTGNGKPDPESAIVLSAGPAAAGAVSPTAPKSDAGSTLPIEGDGGRQ